MRLVATLVVRDEADIVEAQIAYHLNAGVDFVLATDHDSHDGTTEILERYEREGRLRLFRESGPMNESAWRTRMARLAATDHGADWIINTDADEFWMPPRGTLVQALAAVPERFGVVWGLTRHFVPRPEDVPSFAERMTVRVASPAPINELTTPYRPHAKVAHRADPEIIIRFGAHLVFTDRLEPLRNWYPADVLHFPFRTLEQYERKGVRRAHGDKPLGQYVKAYRAREEGRLAEIYRSSLLVDDETLERGRLAGSLVSDTRLRDALRVVREEGEADLGHRDVAGSIEDHLRLADASALRGADEVRFLRRVDLLGSRLAAVEERARSRSQRRLSLSMARSRRR